MNSFISCVSRNNCSSNYLTDSTWIVSEVENEKIILSRERKILNEEGSYIPSASEMQILFNVDKKVEINHVRFDEFQEVFIPSIGMWTCQNNIITLEEISVYGKDKFTLSYIDSNKLILECKESGVRPQEPDDQ